MKKWYEIKVRAIVGPDPGDDKEVRILGRTVKWGEDFLKYEADDKYVEKIIDELGLGADSKGRDVPIEKDYDHLNEDVELLDPGQAREYRRLAATVNYLALDRPDLQFVASVLGRTMSKPNVQSWANLKKVGRYLKSHPKVEYEYQRVNIAEVQELVGYSDSDWAGCKTTRRSTSGGLVVLGGGVLRSWSNRQATTALSSAEAEFYSAAKAAAELLAVQSFMNDLGWHAVLRLMVDASAAQAMAARQGIGKVRHLEVRHLWLQEVVKRGAIKVRKVQGRKNPADVLTKIMGHGEMMQKLKAVNIQ